MADTPNRFTVEFQDALNEYQQDSFSLVDADDVARSGQEVSQTLAAVGIPNFDQAARILKLNLDRSVRGNTYVEFETQRQGVWNPARRPDHRDLPQRRTDPAAVPGAEDRTRREPPDYRQLRRRFTTIPGTTTATAK